jgi:hypothetical protein
LEERRRKRWDSHEALALLDTYEATSARSSDVRSARRR